MFLSTRTAILCPHACCRGYHQLRGFFHRCAHLEIQPRLLKNLAAFFNVGAFEAQHDRHLHVEVAGRCHHARGQPVHAQNAAEDVDEDRLHIRVGEQDLKGVLDLLLGCAAAYVEEVGRAAAGVLNDVHGRHGQARAVDHAGDGAVELDVVERVLAGFDFERVFFGGVAQRLDVRMAEEGVVVEGDLGVEREELVVLGGDEGIDLDQRGVGIDERLCRGSGRRRRRR